MSVTPTPHSVGRPPGQWSGKHVLRALFEGLCSGFPRGPLFVQLCNLHLAKFSSHLSTGIAHRNVQAEEQGREPHHLLLSQVVKRLT